LRRSPRNTLPPIPPSRIAPEASGVTPNAAELPNAAGQDAQGAALTAQFAAALAALGYEHGTSAALAVSGGGDSMALMRLFADWRGGAREPPAAVLPATVLPVTVLIVDHGLRPESAAHAAQAALWARAAGFPAHILRPETKPGSRIDANIEDWARRVRYALLGGWCRAAGVRALFVAHNEDDQAETFLLRLARGSGIDGLSAMRGRSPFPLPGFDGIELLRPLLGVSRTGLRAFLACRGQGFLHDPMNDDPRFARVRMRALLPLLDAAGLSPSRLAAAAGHLGRGRDALEGVTDVFLHDHAVFTGKGEALLDARALAGTAPEIGLRALALVLMRVSGASYRPRFVRLERLFEAVTAPDFARARTLLGCRVGKAPKERRQFGPGTLWIAPEGVRNRPSRREG
jgi:tRNA(Ile)-lysidine synthase